MAAPRVVACPQCRRPVEWVPASRWRPFCSERCKMIDLGAWASEAYRVPVTEAPDDEPSIPADETGRTRGPRDPD
jgi:endogenous inhibitor of DNA gyrase (YacG/DUF329 family)